MRSRNCFFVGYELFRFYRPHGTAYDSPGGSFSETLDDLQEANKSPARAGLVRGTRSPWQGLFAFWIVTQSSQQSLWLY